MTKSTKSWKCILEESLKSPSFRQEWEDANAELADLDKILAARAEACTTQEETAIRAGEDQCATARYRERHLQEETTIRHDSDE